MKPSDSDKEFIDASIAALHRLWEIAWRNSGQPRHVARFLLSLYNGERFPFDLSDFRCLDTKIFEDCLLVLEMDSRYMTNVHNFFKDGEQSFEKLASLWRFTSHKEGTWR